MTVLYSFRRCPYAMRARMALYLVGIEFEIREINLKNKHAEFLAISPKGTVPVLVLDDHTIIDESVDIVDFALPNQPLTELENKFFSQLNEQFIPALMRFKYHDRYDDVDIEHEQNRLCAYLQQLDENLAHSSFLCEKKQLAKLDILILPFIRQLYRADDKWFDDLPCVNLLNWLRQFMNSDLYDRVMTKYPVYQ